ncbi:MAG: hypothetical protein C0499_02325 [Zymomonas sp.]|nr:hypothetical protein [Zymomonas sp.]
MTLGKPDTLTFRWLTGILVTIVLALVAFWARDLSGHVGALHADVREQSIITAEMRGQLGEVVGRLRRIEDNQDADVMIGRRR